MTDTFDLSSELTKAHAGEQLSVTDLVSIDDLSSNDIELIFRVAAVMKRFVGQGGGHKKTDLLRGFTVCNFFNENSTRTRTSFEIAAKMLGADVVNIAGATSSGKKGETLGDTARTLDAYDTDILVVRDAASGVPAHLAELVRASVVNAGDGWHEHPTQALLDAFTIREHFGERPLTIINVGDVKHSRVFGSHVRLFKKLGYTHRVAAWETLRSPHLADFGIETHNHLDAAALDGVDVIYSLRLQTERAAGRDIPTPREYAKAFSITKAKLALAKPDAVVMHAGPVIREFCMSSDVLESDRCLVQPMVANGLVIRMAVQWLLATNETKKITPWK